MTHAKQPQTTPTPRRDGWTPERRRRFLEDLSAGFDVQQACARVGMSPRGAYKLRRRDAAFARAWGEARHAARAAAEQAFLALLPEKLRGTLSALSGSCEFRRKRVLPLDRVPGVPSL